MFEVAQVASVECPNHSRIKRCLICNRKWRTNEKSKWLLTWGRAPRTWVNRAVILLSMLNVVFADFASDVADVGWDAIEENGHYSRQWAVSIEGGQEVADRIAAKHDFINLGKIFGNFYHFEHKRLAKRSSFPHVDFHRNLINEAEVKWAQQQIFKKRSKRDLITPRPRMKSNNVRFNDEEWPKMWYLNRGQGLDMNVQGAWREGITGSGVVVTILDDGLEKDHPDLRANYDSQASYDVNNHDEDPMPRYDPIDSNRHGTRCAGEVAAVANNTMCSVGVAFGASVGGVRMLDGDVTDAVEARSLSLNPQHIDIYSASWGPDDDGKTVDGPGELATRAFIEGVTKGRQGKGSIFVWASGNGGREHDNCNCDGYTNSIWTLSISSATEKGLVPWYSEACSSTLATTYSSGAVNERQIVTTDLRHKCTSGHTGTSASAPLAAGICALALEANRELTWRDMQHIVVRTARPANLQSLDWKVNGVGRKVSHSFGYGLMDATAMVKLARIWKTVPEQHRCEVSAPHVNKPIPPRSKVILKLNVTECTGVNYLEHVQAKISLSSAQRGGLQIFLTSPAGTKATLLAKRPQDVSRIPFTAWPFMSVHTWGEMPFGVWQLEIHYEGHFMGHFEGWEMLFYGTEVTPNEETETISKENQGRNRGNEKMKSGNGASVEGRRGESPEDVASRRPESSPPKGSWMNGPESSEDTSSGCAAMSKSTYRCLECISGMHLHEGRCITECPAKTFAGSIVGTATICRPCHYTCLTCAGESDGHCTSCHEGASPVPSGLEVAKVSYTAPAETNEPVEDGPHWSWGRRSAESLSYKGDSDETLGSLFYCYSSKLIDRVKVTESWYYRMTILFALNIVILLSITVLVIWKKYFKCETNDNKDATDELSWRYLKISNGDPEVTFSHNNINNPPSCSDEEEQEYLVDKKKSIIVK